MINTKTMKIKGLNTVYEYRLIKTGTRKRLYFYKDKISTIWVCIPQRKSYRNLKPELREIIKEWILNRPYVKASLISNDTLIVKGKDVIIKRVGKFFLEISVRIIIMTWLNLLVYVERKGPLVMMEELLWVFQC